MEEENFENFEEENKEKEGDLTSEDTDFIENEYNNHEEE
jgi:hypothetical protein